MFDSTSRYRDLPVATYVDERGRAKPWVTLRIPADPTATVTYTVRARDRLDLLAYRAYADPTQWWRLGDANPQATTGLPHELLDTPGTEISLAQPVRAEVMPQ